MGVFYVFKIVQMVPNRATYHIYYLYEALIQLTYRKAFESTFPSLQNTSYGNHGSIPQMNATGQCAQPKKNTSSLFVSAVASNL